MYSVICNFILVVPYETLTTLSLGSNSVRDDGAEYLAGALIVNQVRYRISGMRFHMREFEIRSVLADTHHVGAQRE